MLTYLLQMLTLVLIAFTAILWLDYSLNKDEIRSEREWQKFQKSFKEKK